MNNPIVLVKYKIYKYFLKKKSQRAVNAEHKFIKSLTAIQRDYYEKVIDMLKNPDTDVVYINEHLLLKGENSIITIDVFLNNSFLTYTSKTEKGTFHAEQTFGEDSKLFFMQHVESNFSKKRKSMLEEKTRMIESLLA